MSDANTPATSVHSIQSLNQPITCLITIETDKKGLKSFLMEYLVRAKVFAEIQRTSKGITKVVIQGPSDHVQKTINVLKGVLIEELGIENCKEELIAVTNENRLNNVSIRDSQSIKRANSSGEDLYQQFEEISFGGSANTEYMKKIATETFQSIFHLGKGYLSAQGYIQANEEKHISVKHKDQRFDLEVSNILSINELLSKAEKKFDKISPIKLLYREEDGDFIVVTDVKDLKKDHLYHVLTHFEELPKKQPSKFSPQMEEFYEKLKSNEELDDEEVSIIKNTFANQKIKFKQLMATGELEITDEKLKEDGILQRGLRTAILSVIKNNR